MLLIILNQIKNKSITNNNNVSKIMKEIKQNIRLNEFELTNVKNSLMTLKKREKDLQEKINYYQELEKDLKHFNTNKC